MSRPATAKPAVVASVGVALLLGSATQWVGSTAVLSALLLPFGSLAACGRNHGGGPALDRNKVLVVVPEVGTTWSRNFNPLLVAGSQLWPAQGGIYEPLLVFDSLHDRYEPWLAQSVRWNAEHDKLWLQLRPGVRWADGAPFTSKDVAFTFAQLKNQRAFDAYGVWEVLERVEAEAELRVRFDFARTHVPSLFGIASQCIVPEHHYGKQQDLVRFTDPDPIGTGPVSAVLRFSPQVYELGRNPRHWRPGVPAYEAIRVPAFPSNDQGNLALLHGEIDWAGVFVPAVERVYVGRDPAHHHYWFPAVSGTVMLYPNTTRSPLDSAAVRKGLSLAIDRQLMVRVAVHGYSAPADATGLTHSYDRWRSPKAVQRDPWTSHDPGRASALLDSAGLRRGPDGRRTRPDGSPLKLEVIVVSGWSDWVVDAQIVSRGLAAVGVETRLRALERGAWLERVEKGDFDLAVGWSNGGPSPYRFYRETMSADTVVPLGQATPVNWHRFGNPEATELLHRFELTSDEKEQWPLMERLQLLFVDLAPAIPLYPQAAWGEYNDARFTGFPNAADPYARLPPFPAPEFALVLGRIRPR